MTFRSYDIQLFNLLRCYGFNPYQRKQKSFYEYFNISYDLSLTKEN